MAEIDAAWFGLDDGARTVMDYEALPDTNGTLRMALDTSILPFAYVKDNRVVGYDVDIAARFCQANGYRLEVVPMDFGGVLPAVQTGKCDFAGCCITYTEERAESVLFSSPIYRSGTVLCVLKDGGAPVATPEGAYTSIDQLDGKRIGVQDLTKMGDIVRSRTYEAFFPLIAVTVIYFVLETLIGFLVGRASVNFNPKRRKPADILKGVKTDDQN